MSLTLRQAVTAPLARTIARFVSGICKPLLRAEKGLLARYGVTKDEYGG